MMQRNLSLGLFAVSLVVALPAAAAPRADEPIAVPFTVKQGIDFVYVDPAMSTVAKRRQTPRNWLQRVFQGADKSPRANPVFINLARGLEQYRAGWGALPQVKIPVGSVLSPGATGRRVQLLRTRLGLSPLGGYDGQLQQRVWQYQQVHGLSRPDGVAGRATIASLNLGAGHYARRIAINMERAWRLPMTNTFDRYVLVDSGAAMAYLYSRDRPADAMRVVVGSTKTKTPMMAVLMRTAKANPYWNVPPDLARSLTAKRVLKSGPSYLKDFHYEVLSDWSPSAQPVDPISVDWKRVAAGRTEVRVRQLPGPWNSMGEMKFEMPNEYGIYLHDTPHKELFAQSDRWLSNGCVRLADYRRFASWVFGRMPPVSSSLEETLVLPRPVPVYLTYLTVEASGGGIMFRPDPYGFDALAAPQMRFGPGGRGALAR